MNRAKIRYAKCPTGADEWPSWLFLMQHYGLPTRLLDWSESPLIALYFAVKEAAYQEKNGRIWCLQPYKLNLLCDVNGIALPQMQDAHFLCQEAFIKERNPSEKTLSVIGDHFDVRHLVQSAAFTIHGTTIALNEHQERSQFLLEFEVSGKMKRDLLDALKVVGVRESYLFPDLDHLAHDLEGLADIA
jgi:FRG domain